MTRRLAVLLLTATALAGCSRFQKQKSPVEISASAVPTASRWNASLATPSDLAGALQVRGVGWMAAAAPGGGTTRADVSISNAAPGGVHPWHVHRGQCGNDQGIFGPADAYRPLRVGDNGMAVSSATLPEPVPTSGDFFVNVHASPANMGAIVACGNLAPPTQ